MSVMGYHVIAGLLVCLMVLQSGVYGRIVCSAPEFSPAANDTSCCFHNVPPGTPNKPQYCTNFESTISTAERGTAILYAPPSLDVCYYYIYFLDPVPEPPEGCCGGGLPGRR